MLLKINDYLYDRAGRYNLKILYNKYLSHIDIFDMLIYGKNMDPKEHESIINNFDYADLYNSLIIKLVKILPSKDFSKADNIVREKLVMFLLTTKIDIPVNIKGEIELMLQTDIDYANLHPDTINTFLNILLSYDIETIKRFQKRFDVIEYLNTHPDVLESRVLYASNHLDDWIKLGLKTPRAKFLYDNPKIAAHFGVKTFTSERPNVKFEYYQEACNDGVYLPVYRIPDLYYPLNDQYCGTFYFYEPESTEHLNLGKTFIAANKLDAYMKLKFLNGIISNNNDEEKNVNDARRQYGKMLDTYSILDNYESRRFLTKLLQSVKDAEETVYKLDTNMYINALYYLENGDNISGKAEYFDFLDQELCNLGSSNGYDTIILQREPGKYRPNTEILDTRSRNVSYNSICILPRIMKISKYPTIWFAEDGLVSLPERDTTSVKLDQIIPLDTYENMLSYLNRIVPEKWIVNLIPEYTHYRHTKISDELNKYKEIYDQILNGNYEIIGNINDYYVSLLYLYFTQPGNHTNAAKSVDIKTLITNTIIKNIPPDKPLTEYDQNLINYYVLQQNTNILIKNLSDITKKLNRPS